MAKQWIKQQVKRDELHEYVGRGASWPLANRQTFLTVAGGALGALLLGGLFLYKHRSAQLEAWDKLSVAQVYAYSGQADASLQQIQAIEAEYGNAKAAAFAQLFAGDIQFQKGALKDAVASYSKLLERNDPQVLLPFAQANLALVQEAAGQCQEAAASSQRFLDLYSDHFLAPQAHASLARCLKHLGQPDQAKLAYQKIALQYPDTHWARWAQAKLAAN